ncbi:MAG: glycosyltransferase [Leptospirillia bacterium]
MDILLAGDWHSTVHEEPVHHAFTKLGHQVHPFSWYGYFHSGNAPSPRGTLGRLVGKAQNRLMAGPAFSRLNRDFIAQIGRIRPDLSFIYRGTHITRQTLEAARHASPKTVLIGYNNDNPFATGHPALYWRHFLRALPAYDMVLAYRERNLRDFMRAGARDTRLLRSWFIPDQHRPVPLTDTDRARFACDVVFVGHYEPDGRLEMLEQVVEAGFHLKLFGPGYEWDEVLARSPRLRHLAPVELVWKDDYAKALCGAKVALCFLSKLNHDSYTRRCFEIPACGTLMLSEQTDDLAGMFRQGEEADFFQNGPELVQKLRHYVYDDALRNQVADAGRKRVVRDRHDVISRMEDVLEWATPIAGAPNP